MAGVDDDDAISMTVDDVHPAIALGEVDGRVSAPRTLAVFAARRDRREAAMGRELAQRAAAAGLCPIPEQSAAASTNFSIGGMKASNSRRAADDNLR